MYIYYESIVLQTCLFGPTVFPTCFPVCDMFHTCELTGCDGKTFQLNLEIVWHHVDALCCSWNAMEPGWAKACPDKWVSHFGNWSRRGFQNIVWLICWMGWNPVKVQQPASALLNLGNCGPESFSQGISGRAYSCRIALEGCHRTPEDPIALHTPTHRSSYSTKGIVHQKNLRRQPKTFFFEKLTWRVFFIFFLFGGKMLWNLIIWNMGEIVVFPAFWTVAHTIAFHEILILLTRGGYGNSRLLS